MSAYIPANPIVDLRSLVDRRPLPVPPPGLFSVARHALLAYLSYLSRRRGRPARDILLPDYMCHEVARALREAGYRPSYYPLDESFEPPREALERAARGGADAVVVAHFYGRLCRGLGGLVDLCRRLGAALIEDCVHLPFPYPVTPLEADARLYTMRKVYPVPSGAAIVLREGQEDFARFVEGTLGRTLPPGSADLWSWAVRQAAKKALSALGAPYSQPYRDLSQDPLKSYNFADPRLADLLSMSNCERAVIRRRENCRLYRTLAPLAAWGTPLDFDLQLDVPYQLPLVLPRGADAQAAVRRLMAGGVPAGLGMAIDDAVLGSLESDHRYRRIIALPVHQDVRERDVRNVAAVMARDVP